MKREEKIFVRTIYIHLARLTAFLICLCLFALVCYGIYKLEWFLHDHFHASWTDTIGVSATVVFLLVFSLISGGYELLSDYFWNIRKEAEKEVAEEEVATDDRETLLRGTGIGGDA